jgi:hypothetical protein
MGAKSLQILTGKRKIFDWMGAPIQGAAFDEKGKAAVLRKKDPAPDKSRDFRKWTLLPMLHPAFCLPHREPAWLPVFHIHLLRAWQFANGTPPPWKWPNIYLPGLYDAKHNREALRALKRIRKRALKGGTIAPDVETNHKDPLQADLRNIGISDDFDAVSITYPLLDTKSVHECDQLMRSILADERIKKEMQNGGYDDLNLHRNGYEINGWDFDTLIGYRLIAPQLLSSLAIQSAIEFPCERWKDEFGEGKDPIRFCAESTTRRTVTRRTCIARRRSIGSRIKCTTGANCSTSIYAFTKSRSKCAASACVSTPPSFSNVEGCSDVEGTKQRSG